jgi:hypothetical protein
MGMDDG